MNTLRFFMFSGVVISIFAVYLIFKAVKCYFFAKWITKRFGDEDDKNWWKKHIDDKR